MNMRPANAKPIDVLNRDNLIERPESDLAALQRLASAIAMGTLPKFFDISLVLR